MRSRVVLLLAVVAVGGCRCDSFKFYDVTRTPTQACEIRPNGEFCDANQLPPPQSESWSVEYVGDERRVYVDEEVWVAAPVAKDADPNQYIADKIEVATRDPGPCTTTTTRSFKVLATDVDLTGELREKSELVGGADCGDTPRGARATARLDGKNAGAP